MIVPAATVATVALALAINLRRSVITISLLKGPILLLRKSVLA